MSVGPVLVADVGGTNCRIGVGEMRDGAPHVDSVRIYHTGDFSAPAQAVMRYLEEAGGGRRFKAMGLAVAGPVGGDVVDLTNSNWRFSREQTQSALGLEALVVVNDLQALARAVLDLHPRDLEAVGGIPSNEPDEGPIAVVAPGTGLGVGMAFDKPRTMICATEGGHTSFAPNDSTEIELLKVMRLVQSHVSHEHILSGPGMVRLHRNLGVLERIATPAIEGPEIVTKALNDEDRLCRETAERFCQILGAFCGDVALTQGARRVVLAGSIATSLLPIMQRGGFRGRFEDRGPGHSYMRKRPTLVAARSDLGLVGAFLSARDRLSEASAS